MKNQLYLFLPFILLLIYACNSNSEGGKETEEHIVVEITYNLDTTKSIINWTRLVDYKHITTKVKVFGAYADVSMDNVQYETTGEIIPIGGFLNTEDDVLVSGRVDIDLSLIRFYSQQEEQFFVSEECPPAYIELIEITKDSTDNYTVMADFVMESESIAIDFPAVITSTDGFFHLSGEILLIAAKLPILNQPDPENVNMDEITFVLDFRFFKED